MFLKSSFVLYHFLFVDSWSVCFMIGTTVVPFFSSRNPPCCPWPVFATEIRCRTDGSNIQHMLALSIHLNVDLISVPPYTPTWNYFYSCLTEYKCFDTSTCFYQAHELNEILDYLSMCRMSN